MLLENAIEWICKCTLQKWDERNAFQFLETFLAVGGAAQQTRDTAIRQNGAGLWMHFEYSQLLGQHWRATTGFTLIRGEPDDFLGQYRRNSHAIIALRYSF